MPTQPPTSISIWLSEVLDHLEMAAMAAAGQGLDDEPDQQRWISFMQRQAVTSCRTARGLDEFSSLPERELDELEEVDDLAHDLRNGLPSDGREVVSEAQLFLLFYLAAHIRAGVCDRNAGQNVVNACWRECGSDACDDEPWPVNGEPPEEASAWVDEIIGAYANSGAPPLLMLGDGSTFRATEGVLLETATVLALGNRGAAPHRAAVEELIGTITAMEADVSGMGPEWQAMRRIPSLAFAMYYVWVHLSIGLTSEDVARGVMRECTARIGEFRDPLPRSD
jgi:hypothetical protein